jgi:hypothetical protein
MNKLVIFLFIAAAILIFSIISISVAPIINLIKPEFSQWGKFNCQYYADIAKYSDSLDEKFKNEEKRNLCYRQNAMYGLEYSSFIIDIGLGFICAQLALFHYFQIGKSFIKYTGLIGLIGGAIGFILTLVYVCFSGYIFTNDTAFKYPDNADSGPFINKLYPNGASYKYAIQNVQTSAKIYPYSNDKSYDSQYIKYKDLGDSQYNYDKKFYEAYYGLRSTGSATCKTIFSSSCEYYYDKIYDNNENKYLYDRWCLSLVLSVFITISNIGLLIFGFLLFKGGDNSGNAQVVKIE